MKLVFHLVNFSLLELLKQMILRIFTLCWFLLSVARMISTSYFDITQGGVHFVAKITRMGKFFSGLCALTVPYKHGGMGSDEYN